MQSTLAKVGVVAFLVAIAAFVWFLSRSDAPGLSPASPHVATSKPPAPLKDVPEPTRAVARRESAPSSQSAPVSPAKQEAFPADPHAIRGTIADEQGNPIQDARVRVASEASVLIRGVTSSADGAFVATELPPGAYTITATHATHQPATVQGIRAGTQTVALVMKGLAVATGNVVSERTGAPVTQFEVAAISGSYLDRVPADDAWVACNDAQGRFRLDGVPLAETVTLLARAPNFAIGYATLTRPDASKTTDNVIIRLPDGCRVEGIVKSVQGSPVAGAQVFIGEAAAGKPIATSDERGAFTLTTLALTDTSLKVSHPEYLASTVPVAPRKGATTRVEVVLDSGGVIEGAVTRGAQPAAGVSVVMRAQDGSSPETKTNEDGHYRFAAVAPGETMVFLGSAGNDVNQGRVMHKTVEVESGKIAIADFDMAATGASLEGLVTLNGQPPESGTVYAEIAGPQNDDVVSTNLSPDGAYRFDTISPGSVKLHVTINAGSMKRTKLVELTLNEGESAHEDIVFAEAFSIAGTLTGMHEGETATVFVLAGDAPNVHSAEDVANLHSQVVAEQSLDEDGVFQLDGLEPGSYFISVVAVLPEENADGNLVPRVRSASQSVELSGNSQPHLQLELR